MYADEVEMLLREKEEVWKRKSWNYFRFIPLHGYTD